MPVQRLLMPKLGLTMTEGTVIEWPIAVGGTFARGAVCVVVETDKVANEIEAPEAGRLLKILVQEGETVPVGSVLAEWETDAKQSEAQAGTGTVAAPAAAAAPEPVRRKPGASELAAARRLTAAKQNIPHFYLSTEIEVSALQVQRAQWNAGGTRPKLTLTHLFLAALARTLAAQPELNRIWDEEYFVDLPGVDLGIAVNTDRGLIVPVLRNADRMDLGQLATTAAGLVARAQRRTLPGGGWRRRDHAVQRGNVRRDLYGLDHQPGAGGYPRCRQRAPPVPPRCKRRAAAGAGDRRGAILRPPRA